MSQVLIQQYLNSLQDLRRVSGTNRESVVREAFKDLLKGWARQHDLVFVPEYEITTPAKDRRYVDGALLHTLRMPFGYWEAKDEKGDLDAEIDFKLRRGYPQDLFHEALLDGGQPCSSGEQKSFKYTQCLRGITHRLIAAMLGYSSNYIGSRWDCLGTCGF